MNLMDHLRRCQVIKKLDYTVKKDFYDAMFDSCMLRGEKTDIESKSNIASMCYKHIGQFYLTFLHINIFIYKFSVITLSYPTVISRLL